MKQQIRYLAAIGIVAVVLVSSTPDASYADRTSRNDQTIAAEIEDGKDEDEKDLKQQRDLLRESQSRANRDKSEAEKELEAVKAARQAAPHNRALSESVKKSCQSREAAVREIIDRAKTTGAHHFESISNIYANIISYAEKKHIALTKFADQIANVESSKSSARAALSQAQTLGDDFNCDDAAPKAAASVFLATKKKQSAALRSYRDSVKQLLVAVKSAVYTDRAGRP